MSADVECLRDALRLCLALLEAKAVLTGTEAAAQRCARAALGLDRDTGRRPQAARQLPRMPAPREDPLGLDTSEQRRLREKHARDAREVDAAVQRERLERENEKRAWHRIQDDQKHPSATAPEGYNGLGLNIAPFA